MVLRHFRDLLNMAFKMLKYTTTDRDFQNSSAQLQGLQEDMGTITKDSTWTVDTLTIIVPVP